MNLILVDASHLYYRCWNAYKLLKTSKGQLTGLQFGVMRTLMMFKKRLPDSVIIFCLDGSPHYRKNLSSTYKAHRNSNPEVYKDQNEMNELLLAAGVILSYHPDFESDDMIAMLCKSTGFDHIYVYSGDDDFCQLAREPGVLIWKPTPSNAGPKEKKDRIWGEPEIFKEWNVRSLSLPLYRSFIGDASDEIKGLPYVPRAPLQQAVAQCIYPHDFYEHKSVLGDPLNFFSKDWRDKLLEFRQQCELNFKLTLLPYAFLAEVPMQSNLLNPEKLHELLTALEFNSFTTKFDETLKVLRGNHELVPVISGRSQPRSEFVS